MMQQPPPGYGPQQGYGPPPGYGPPQGYAPQPPKKKGIPWWAWMLGIIFLGFAGCLGVCVVGVAGVANKANEEKEAYDKAEAIKVTATDMIAEYKKNEIAADEKYKKKKIEISGTIREIDSSIGDEPVVNLSSGKELDFASALLYGIPKSEAAKLEKGKQGTFVCKGDGEIMGSPILRECKQK